MSRSIIDLLIFFYRFFSVVILLVSTDVLTDFINKDLYNNSKGAIAENVGCSQKSYKVGGP